MSVRADLKPTTPVIFPNLIDRTRRQLGRAFYIRHGDVIGPVPGLKRLPR